MREKNWYVVDGTHAEAYRQIHRLQQALNTNLPAWLSQKVRLGESEDRKPVTIEGWSSPFDPVQALATLKSRLVQRTARQVAIPANLLAVFFAQLYQQGKQPGIKLSNTPEPVSFIRPPVTQDPELEITYSDKASEAVKLRAESLQQHRQQLAADSTFMVNFMNDAAGGPRDIFPRLPQKS